MIFDSPQIEKFLKKYEKRPDFAVPNIVFLSRSSKLSGERKRIECIMKTLPESVKREWSSRFITEDHAQHKSVWFQIMLQDWLSQIGKAIPEPELEGNRPDFLVTIDKLQIVIEAYAFLKPDFVQQQEMWEKEIIWVLNNISAPSCVLGIEQLELVSRVNITIFREKVKTWLHGNPEKPFQFEDAQGNRIVLKKLYYKNEGEVSTIGPARELFINSNIFTNPLRKKAYQHKKVRQAKYPYIIAIYLEDKTYSPEEIVEAWFGKTVVALDSETLEFRNQYIDRSGIAFFKNTIRHRSVSGTLVFNDTYDDQEKCRKLQAWYIQNPYANKPIDSAIFPTKARFVVKTQDDRNVEMGWVYKNLQEEF